MLMNANPDNPIAQGRIAKFREGLEQLGWTDGRNLRIELRWGWPADDANLMRAYATEMVALAPDVVLATTAATLAPLLQATRTIPIVFTIVADPVGAGYVDSLAVPGANATGFMQFECTLISKWLELLKEIAPQVRRATAGHRRSHGKGHCRATGAARRESARPAWQS